jgi:XamI restriction endonuclease
MMVPQSEMDHHAAQAKVASDVYVAGRSPVTSAGDWNAALRIARNLIADAIRESKYLTDVAAALQKNGAYMLVYRGIAAPPISQDQFALICPEWRKSTEKDARPVSAAAAACVARAFHAWRSRSLTQWLDQHRPPFRRELRRLLLSIGPLIAIQQLKTVQRNRESAQQEGAILTMLQQKGWTRQPGKLLVAQAGLPLKHYMHKIKFATKSGTPKEVDVALGLKGTVVLAMECKVSNDVTNSVKRVDDVLNKATAWKDHWGNFVKPAALLQGVIAPKDVNRLLASDVNVFWSHDLKAFEAWIDSRA